MSFEQIKLDRSENVRCVIQDCLEKITKAIISTSEMKLVGMLDETSG